MFSRKKPLITILDSCSTSETKNLKEDGAKSPCKGKTMITKIDDNMVEKLAEVIREANEMALCGIYARVWFDFRDEDSWSTESASSNEITRAITFTRLPLFIRTVLRNFSGMTSPL